MRGFKLITAVKIQVEVFRVVMPRGDVVGYQRFGGACCFHLQGEVFSGNRLAS
jgi:hypothetical protein